MPAGHQRSYWRFGAVLTIAMIALAPNALLAEFKDPAPPEVHEIRAEKPTATAQAGLKFHAAPRPLKPDAVVTDWPWLLGPTHNNRSSETKLLTDLGAKVPPIVWEVSRGSAYAAPAVAAGRAIHFHRVEDDEVVECLEAETGRRFWRVAYPVTYDDRYGYSNGPRCSPIIDDDRVYTYGVTGILQCLDLVSGQLVWRRDILKDFKLEQNFFGVGAAPLVEGNLIIVNVGADGPSEAPSVGAFDKTTGKLVWGAGEKYGPSYATPIPANIHGKRRVLVFAGGESTPPTGGLMCIDPASGKLDFQFDWRSRTRESVNASSPVVVGNRVFISECYGRGSTLLEIQPDFTVKQIWEDEDFGTHFMTSIFHDGFLYGIHGHGPIDCELVCLDISDGKEKWRKEPHWEETITRAGSPPRKIDMELNRSQLLYVDGRALCLTENGHLLWLDLNPQGYKELSRAFLFAGEEGWTGPVLSHGLLYVCQNSKDILTGAAPRLICYDLRSP